MEHTPKNILLRAVRADEKRVTKKAREQRLKNVNVFADRADVGEIVGR